jgi:hypothetical protein
MQDANKSDVGFFRFHSQRPICKYLQFKSKHRDRHDRGSKTDMRVVYKELTL